MYDDPDPTVLRMLHSGTTHELAEVAARKIVQVGGTLTEDGEGRSIYPRRIDVRIPVTVFDPALGRSVTCQARIRITVEIDSIFGP